MPKIRPKASQIMPGSAVDRAVCRIAKEIGQRDRPDADRTILVGIQTGGVQLARRLATQLAKLWNREVPVGQLDVAMHRDDLHRKFAPQVHPTSIPFDINEKLIVLVDDVLFSGRTCRAAMDALLDLGRPTRIQLAVLVDRGHREMPIQPDFVGKTVKTKIDDLVTAEILPEKGASGVFVEKQNHQPGPS